MRASWSGADTDPRAGGRVLEKRAISARSPQKRMLSLSEGYLFVQSWGGEKGRNPVSLLENVFHTRLLTPIV